MNGKPKTFLIPSDREIYKKKHKRADKLLVGRATKKPEREQRHIGGRMKRYGDMEHTREKQKKDGSARREKRAQNAYWREDKTRTQKYF